MTISHCRAMQETFARVLRIQPQRIARLGPGLRLELNPLMGVRVSAWSFIAGHLEELELLLL